MDMNFDVVLGPDGQFPIPANVLESRQWREGSTLTLMSTAHGLIINEREELERIIESRLESLDPVAAYIEELARDHPEKQAKGQSSRLTRKVRKGRQ